MSDSTLPKKPLLSPLTQITLISLVLASLTIGVIYSYLNREPKLGGGIDLIYRDQPWSLADHASPLTLFYVGYAKCPDVCPMTLSHVAGAYKKLSEDEAKKVQVLFLSVDFAHDTAADVANYAAQFHPSFIGLTGSETAINDTVDRFGVSYILEKDPKSYLGYSISHTDRVLILDRRGAVLESISSPRSSDAILFPLKGYL
jgi:protein SCO1/2